MVHQEREGRLQRERREKRTFLLLLQFLKLVNTTVIAVALLVGGAIGGLTIVETAKVLAGRTTNARVEVIIDAKATRIVSVGSCMALAGAAGVYVRRRKRLQKAKSSGRRSL